MILIRGKEFKRINCIVKILIYKVLDIIEPDFGCEGLPDGQVPMDEVVLLDEDNNKKVIKQGDMYLYQMDINVGDKVVIVDNKLKKA